MEYGLFNYDINTTYTGHVIITSSGTTGKPKVMDMPLNKWCYSIAVSHAEMLDVSDNVV